jgi:hypothetical protein
MHGIPLPCRGGCDQGWQVNFVGIQQQVDERHLVVGFVAYIAQNDRAGAPRKVIRGRRREHGLGVYRHSDQEQERRIEFA